MCLEGSKYFEALIMIMIVIMMLMMTMVVVVMAEETKITWNTDTISTKNYILNLLSVLYKKKNREKIFHRHVGECLPWHGSDLGCFHIGHLGKA